MWKPTVHEFDQNLIYMRNNELRVHFKKLEDIKKRKNKYFKTSKDLNISEGEIKEHNGNRGKDSRLSKSIASTKLHFNSLNDESSNLTKFLRQSPLREKHYIVNRDNKYIYDRLNEINVKSSNNVNYYLILV